MLPFLSSQLLKLQTVWGHKGKRNPEYITGSFALSIDNGSKKLLHLFQKLPG